MDEGAYKAAKRDRPITDTHTTRSNAPSLKGPSRWRSLVNPISRWRSICGEDSKLFAPGHKYCSLESSRKTLKTHSANSRLIIGSASSKATTSRNGSQARNIAGTLVGLPYQWTKEWKHTSNPPPICFM